MPCCHTFKSLLARTSFADDGPLVQKAMASARLHQEQRAALTAQPAHHNLSLLPSSLQSSKTLKQLQVPTDQGRRIDSFRIFREYGAYAVSHSEVYGALLHFFGDMTFGPDAVPSDALALAAAAAFMMLVADQTNVNQNIAEETRNTATKAAHLSFLSEKQIAACCKALADKETLEQFWTLYGVLIKHTRDTCTIVTDGLWQICQYMACKLLQIPLLAIDAVCDTPTKDFMKFIAATQRIDMSRGQSISLNTEGELIYDGDTYKAVGYCSQGVMLSRIKEGVSEQIKSITLDQVLGFYLKEHETKFFVRTLTHHNMKSQKDSCAGCSAQVESNDDRLFVYTNALISADLTGATDFHVHKDGTTSFKAQVLMHDREKGRVLRTGFKPLRCEAYDINSLLGFNTSVCLKLSSLFISDGDPGIERSQSEGIYVRSLLERVDDYEVNENSEVISVTHNSAKKWAQKSGKVLLWGDTCNTAFNLDDVVG